MQIENCKLEIADLVTGTIVVSDDATCRLTSESWTASLPRGRARAFDVNPEAKPSICNFQFAIFNFQFLSLLVALCTVLLAFCPAARAQTVADKTVATVTNGARANPDLITYSDIVWQLALEPERVFDPRPGSPELNRALKTLEDQLLILQEARKLPLAQTAEAQKEFENTVTDRRNELAQAFGSRARLEERMARVGLTSEQLNAILRDRVTIDRYLDFRFRAFVLVSAQEIADRYEKIYRALRNSGKLVPTLEQARDSIERTLTEEKIAEEIDKFIDDLREQPGTEIVVLNPV
ncbi:MAG TPA: hypothetical protein VLN44_04795 [Pyrinomonadaceae bacterium]|nr:hypothetical protein [Pyrinomonadaceae bacterium]